VHLVGLICKIIRFTIKISAPIWLLSLLGYYAVLVGELLPTRWPVGALQVSVIVFATPLRHLFIKHEGTAILLNVGTYWQLTLNSWPYKYEGFRILRNVKDYLPLFPKHSQQDASFLDLFIYFYKMLYMFQSVPAPIIRSTKLYTECHVLSTDTAAVVDMMELA
jgi:hypothetical protein